MFNMKDFTPMYDGDDPLNPGLDVSGGNGGAVLKPIDDASDADTGIKYVELSGNNGFYTNEAIDAMEKQLGLFIPVVEIDTNTDDMSMTIKQNTSAIKRIVDNRFGMIACVMNVESTDTSILPDETTKTGLFTYSAVYPELVDSVGYYGKFDGTDSSANNTLYVGKDYKLSLTPPNTSSGEEEGEAEGNVDNSHSYDSTP